MSIRALNWATDMRVGASTAKFVLVALANYADEEGTCFPSVSMLMADTELSRRAVAGAIKRLGSAGLLVTERQRLEDGSLGRNRYHLQLKRKVPLAAPSSDDDEAANQPPCAPDAHGEGGADHVHETTSPCAPHDPPCAPGAHPYKDKPPTEPSIEPSTLRESADARAPETGVNDQADGSSDVDPSEERKKRWAVFWRKWPNTVVDDRDAALKAWGDVPSAQLQDAIDGIEPFFAESKRRGRTKPLSASKYLRQAKWEGLLTSDVADGQVKVLGPWTKAWIAVLVDMLEAGNARGARSMVQLALKGHGRSVHPTRPKTAELLARAETYRLIPAHHDGWALFATWVERRSTESQWRFALPELLSTDEKPFFVAVPPDDVCRALGVPTLPPPTSAPPTDDEAIDAFA